MGTLQVILLILGANVAVWSLAFVRLRVQSAHMLEEARRSGEQLVISPATANYQGWTRRFGMAKTIGRIALTDCRIIFKRFLGRDITIHLEDVAEVSDTAHLGRVGHAFGNYLSLKLRDQTEVLFLVGDQARWIAEIRSRIGQEDRSGV